MHSTLRLYSRGARYRQELAVGDRFHGEGGPAGQPARSYCWQAAGHGGRSHPKSPTSQPPRRSALPNPGYRAAGAPDPDKFFKQVDKVKAEHPDNLCAKYLEKVQPFV